MSRNVARGTLLGIVGQAWHLLTALLLYAFLARRLGPSTFGSWTVALSVLAWFEIFVVAGVAKVATKAISERPEERPALARATYIGQAAFGLVAFVVLLVLAGPIALALSNPAFQPLLRFAALDIPLFALFMAASAVVLGAQRFERQAVAWIVYATAKAVLIATLVAVGFSVPGALVGNALSSLVGFVAVWVPLGKPKPERGKTIRLAREMASESGPYLSVALLEGFGQSVDLWIATAIAVASVFVGFYSAATVFAEIPVFLFLGLNRVIFPSVSNALAGGDDAQASRYATGAVRLALIVTVVGVAFIAAAGRQVITLVYSAKYVGAYLPLVILMVAGMGRTVRSACTEVLLAENRRRDAVVVLAVTVALGAALSAGLALRIGIVGAATGAAIAALAAAAWAAVLLRSRLGTRPLATLLRSVVASVPPALALWFLLPPPSAPTAVLLGETAAFLLLASAAYGLLLRLIGEIDNADLATLRSVAGRQR